MSKIPFEIQKYLSRFCWPAAFLFQKLFLQHLNFPIFCFPILSQSISIIAEAIFAIAELAKVELQCPKQHCLAKTCKKWPKSFWSPNRLPKFSTIAWTLKVTDAIDKGTFLWTFKMNSVAREWRVTFQVDLARYFLHTSAKPN